MSWVYTSNFAEEQGIWAPRDTGFGDLASYVPGTGFVSVDGQLDVGSFSRLDYIITSTFPTSDLNNVTINFDLTLGDFHNGAFACYYIRVTKLDTSTVELSVDFNTAINGNGQILSYDVDIIDAIKVEALVRSSNQVTAVYSGSCMLNSITMNGDGDFSPLGNYTVVVSSGAGAGGAGLAFSPNQSGAYLFFAVEDAGGDQKIVKVNRPTSTSPTFTTVYGPGGGLSANITKHPDIDKMIFHGNFGTDIGVIEHAIGAITNTNKSPSLIGAKLIQPLRVNLGDGTQIIAINRDDQDAIETEDSGDNWSTLNATLGQTVDAMDVGFFGKYIDDVVVIGGNDGVDENLSYSPNEAVSFREDTSAALKAVGSIVSIDRINDLF